MKIWFLTATLICLSVNATAQSLILPDRIAAVQQQVTRESERLRSSDSETRRDAAHRLRLLESPIAARAAATALSDKSEIVRATACEAVAFTTDEEAAGWLTPLLSSPPEKSEYVRREAAFALGEAASKASVPALIKALQIDKKPSVRAAAAISLGKIADIRSVDALSQTLLLPDTKKNRKVIDEFVRRSAARALGEIRDKQAVLTLIAVLRDVSNADDVRREAAFALGIIADQSAVPVLQENINANDYLLAHIAADALNKIAFVKSVN